MLRYAHVTSIVCEPRRERKWFQSVLVADCSVHTWESLSKRSKTKKMLSSHQVGEKGLITRFLLGIKLWWLKAARLFYFPNYFSARYLAKRTDPSHTIDVPEVALSPSQCHVLDSRASQPTTKLSVQANVFLPKRFLTSWAGSLVSYLPPSIA